MKTKVFETGAVCAAIALLVVFSLPAYAKNGGSTASHTRVGKTSTNATSVKTTPVNGAKVKGQSAVGTSFSGPTGTNVAAPVAGARSYY